MEAPSQDQQISRHTVMDTATLYGLLHAFTSSSLESCPLWTLQCAYNATILSLTNQWLQVPPSPQKPDYSRLSELLITRLNGFLGKDRPKGPHIAVYAVQLNEEVMKEAESHRTRLLEVERDASHDNWLDHAVTHFWPELAQLQTGLFDAEFVPALATIMNVDETVLRAVQTRSRDPKVVAAWSKGKNENEEGYELCRKAYFANNCLRGLYYNGISRALYPSDQLVFHPMRQAFLGGSAIHPQYLQHNRTLDYLTAVLLGAAMSQATPQQRVSNWCDNVKRVREYLVGMNSDLVVLGDTDSASAREKRVHLALEQMGLKLHSKRTEQHVGVIFGLSGSALSLALGVWASDMLGPVVTLGGAFLTYTRLNDVPEAIVRKLSTSHARIEELHSYGGGRLMQQGLLK